MSPRAVARNWPDLHIHKTPLGFLRFLLQPVPLKLDLHNMAPRTLLRWIHSAPPPPPGCPDVVVLIGHTREHLEDRTLDEFLKLAGRDPALKFVSFSEVARLKRTTGRQSESMAR